MRRMRGALGVLARRLVRAEPAAPPVGRLVGDYDYKVEVVCADRRR